MWNFGVPISNHFRSIFRSVPIFNHFRSTLPNEFLTLGNVPHPHIFSNIIFFCIKRNPNKVCWDNIYGFLKIGNSSSSLGYSPLVYLVKVTQIQSNDFTSETLFYNPKLSQPITIHSQDIQTLQCKILLLSYLRSNVEKTSLSPLLSDKVQRNTPHKQKGDCGTRINLTSLHFPLTTIKKWCTV